MKRRLASVARCLSAHFSHRCDLLLFASLQSMQRPIERSQCRYSVERVISDAPTAGGSSRREAHRKSSLQGNRDPFLESRRTGDHQRRGRRIRRRRIRNPTSIAFAIPPAMQLRAWRASRPFSFPGARAVHTTAIEQQPKTTRGACLRGALRLTAVIRFVRLARAARPAWFALLVHQRRSNCLGLLGWIRRGACPPLRRRELA